MIMLLDAIRTRLLPALLTALGVVLVTAGLLSYADPTAAGVVPDESQVIETLAPSAALASPSPEPTFEPSGSPGASPSATPVGSAPASILPDVTPQPGRAVATRVVVPALKIDLPIVRGPNGYPYCNVAMYLHSANTRSKDSFGQPGEGRATYLFAHARDGMFGPIYELAMVKHNARKMLGMVVQVYTSDFKVYLYEIREYRLHAVGSAALEDAMTAKKEQLWLQTSEGPKGTPGKTQLIAYPISVSEADPQDAVPKARPVDCG